MSIMLDGHITMDMSFVRSDARAWRESNAMRKSDVAYFDGLKELGGRRNVWPYGWHVA